MYKIHWKSVIDKLAGEDVVIDIRIYNVEFYHWNLLLNRIKLKYEKNIQKLENIDFNQTINLSFFDNDNERYIELLFGEITITLAFYEEKTIEMFSDSIINIEYTDSLKCFFEFIEDLSFHLKKDVTIHHEGVKEFILKCIYNTYIRNWETPLHVL